MSTQQHIQRRQRAADMLSEHNPQLCVSLVIDRLMIGLTQLRETLLVRIRDDVQKHFAMDSMIGAMSLDAVNRQARNARIETEIYSAIVVADEVIRSGYVDSPDEWFADWIFRLRLGDNHKPLAEKRVAFYRSPTIEDRRLKFLSVLQRAVSESAKAPLVLFRLFPRAARIVTAVAFGDPLRAQELRAEQCRLLPAVDSCPECHGAVLDNEESCFYCGNPVWTYEWLTAD